MHNAYISSAVFSLRNNGSSSFSFNDYSNLLNERFDKTPLASSPCCSSCCCCCAFATHRVPINPSFLYGLRQSTLIQWSSSRRRILGGRDPYIYRCLVYNLDDGSYEGSCSLKERSGHGSIGRRRKGNFRRMALEEKSGRYQLGGIDDAQALISLLSEEVGEECLGGRRRDGGSSKRVEVEKRGNYGGECSRGERKRVEVEGRGNYGSQSYRGRKKNTGLDLLESDSKSELKSTTIESREQGYRHNEEREDFLRGRNHRGRKNSSSCSSYYSFSSLGDFGSDTEVQDKDGQFVEESSNGYKDSRKNKVGRSERQIAEEFKRQGNELEGHGEALKHIYNVAGNGVEWDCRKKSEKKLTEVSIQETHSRGESSQIHSRMGRTSESDYRKASDSRKHFHDEEEKSTLAVNLDKETKSQHNQMGNQVIGQSESRRRYPEATEIPEIHDSDVTMASQSQKHFRDREENLMVAVDSVNKTRNELHKTVGCFNGQDDLRRNSQLLTGMSKIQDVDTERISNLQRHSESRMKIWEEDTTLAQSSLQGTKEQCFQTGEKIIGQIDSRRKSERLSELSKIRESNSKKTSILQSETRMKSVEENSSLVSGSCLEAEEQCSQTNQKPLQRTQSKEGFQDVTNVSVVSNIETVTESRRSSETRMVNQENILTTVVKPIGETRERRSQTAERVMQTKSGKEAQKRSRLSISHEKASEEASSGIAVQEIISETSESGSSALYTHSGGGKLALHNESYGRDGRGEVYEEPLNLITHEDAIGSAHRLEESSLQFVGEFVEKARHEVLTAEIRKEKKVSETKLVNEGEKDGQEGLVQCGSEEFQLKELDSRRSSGGSGAKGPSDEMWDVTVPSVQEPPKVEAPEGNTVTGNAVMKRSGRSLWSIIADVVRLRWVSRATPYSATRSSGKSSSNESVSSEAWFSGREPDENSDENAKRDKRSTPKEATSSHHLQLGETLTHSQGETSTSSHHLQLGKTLTQSQGETSDTVKSKNKVRQLEAETSPSSSVLESGSASKGISSTSGEDNHGWNEAGKISLGAQSGMVVVASSAPLPARSLRRSPVVEEITDPRKTNVSESGSMEQLEQSSSSRLIKVSGSQGKDGELKQRKLQRNKQVLKDRFDEWEEAYKLESDQRKVDEMFMREALLEAKKAADTWEVPVGAVLVHHGKIIARGCNLVEELRDSTAHAEMICIREASNVLRSWRLSETTLYVTLEPCPMCAGAILQARITNLVWGAPNKLLGADGSWIRLFPNGGGRNGSELTDNPAAPIHPFHPKMTIRRGVLASDCADVMQQFFQLRRRSKDKNEDPPPPPSCLPPIANHPSKILTKMHDIFHIMFCL